MSARRLGAVAALAATALAVAAARAELAPGDHPRAFPLGGLERSYVLHVPPGYDGAAPVPLVVDMHGLTSNADQQRAISGMSAVSDAHGFLVVYPNGAYGAWNAKTCCGNADVDDVAFIRAVVDAVAAEGAIDRRRVYATGLSNGGAMSHRLACDAADVFAAAAPMAFPLADRPATGCQPARSIPILTVMGLTDALIRYDGGPFGSAPDTFAYWREVNGCGAGAPDVVDARAHGRCEYDTTCANGVQAALCSVTAQAFPGTAFDGHILYLNPDFVLAEVAWDFLSRFTLPASAAPLAEAQLEGADRVTLGGRAPRRSTGPPLSWTVRLGTGTWAAVGDGGMALTGSWRRARARRGRGTLTTAARAHLEALATDRLGMFPATSGPEIALVPAGPVRIGVDRAGAPISWRGRWRVTRGHAGPAIGRYELRLRRRP